MRTLKLKIAVTALALIPFVGFAQETSIQKSKEHQKNMIKELNLNKKKRPPRIWRPFFYTRMVATVKQLKCLFRILPVIR